MCAMLFLTLYPVFQVATDHPLREEELPHHPRHSPLTLCLLLLEGSLLHRASHRATAPPHNSVSPGAMVGLFSTPSIDCLELALGVQSEACHGSSAWRKRMGWPCGLHICWLRPPYVPAARVVTARRPCSSSWSCLEWASRPNLCDS